MKRASAKTKPTMPKLISRNQRELIAVRKPSSLGIGTPAQASGQSSDSVYYALSKEGDAGSRSYQQRGKDLGKQTHRVGVGVTVCWNGDEYKAQTGHHNCSWKVPTALHSIPPYRKLGESLVNYLDCSMGLWHGKEPRSE